MYLSFFVSPHLTSHASITSSVPLLTKHSLLRKHHIQPKYTLVNRPSEIIRRFHPSRLERQTSPHLPQRRRRYHISLLPNHRKIRLGLVRDACIPPRRPMGPRHQHSKRCHREKLNPQYHLLRWQGHSSIPHRGIPAN